MGESENSAGSNGGSPPTRIDVHKLHHWVAMAQPSARLVYGHGWYARDLISEAVHDKLNALQEMGYLNLVQGGRDTRGRDYMAIRTSRPWPKSAMPKKPLAKTISSDRLVDPIARAKALFA